jgi:hypothetical protein
MPVLPFTEGRDDQQGDRWRSVLAVPRVRADLEPVATEVRQRTTVTPGNSNGRSGWTVVLTLDPARLFCLPSVCVLHAPEIIKPAVSNFFNGMCK